MYFSTLVFRSLTHSSISSAKNSEDFKSWPAEVQIPPDWTRGSNNGLADAIFRGTGPRSISGPLWPGDRYLIPERYFIAGTNLAIRGEGISIASVSRRTKKTGRIRVE